MTRQYADNPQFYLTAPSPCPYLPGRMERKVFTHLVGDRAAALNDVLTQGGFRRSQNIAYRPACESCRACISVRIVVDAFDWTKSFRRTLRNNADLVGVALPAAPSSEQYSLFRRYLDARHTEGGMADMSVLDYAMMIEDTHVETMVVEYRRRVADSAAPGGGFGPALAVALTARSVGTFLILDHVRRARAEGLPFVYLGYWVEGSRKMGYKRRFAPQEHLGPRGWERV